MFSKIFAAVAALALSSAAAGAATLNEADFGEFGDSYDTPTNFSGYSTIIGSSNGSEDFEYFWFDSLQGGSSLDFTLTNTGSGSNMLIRLSATPFSMAEWDWTIQNDEFDADNMEGRELYANQWASEDSYSFLLPEDYEGPVYGFARFYSTNSPSTFTLNATVSAVPLPGALGLMLAGLGAVGVVTRARRKTA